MSAKTRFAVQVDRLKRCGVSASDIAATFELAAASPQTARELAETLRGKNPRAPKGDRAAPPEVPHHVECGVCADIFDAHDPDQLASHQHDEFFLAPESEQPSPSDEGVPS